MESYGDSSDDYIAEEDIMESSEVSNSYSNMEEAQGEQVKYKVQT